MVVRKTVETKVSAPVAESVKVKEKMEVIEETFDDLEFEESEVSGGYDEVYFIKMKTKDLAYFEFSKKVGDKIHKDPRTSIQTIDGKLTRIELGSYTYENKEVKTFKMYISKEINNKSILFILSTSYTQASRSIINALLGCQKPIEKVNISVYKNASGYTSVKMSINGAKSEWKLSIDEQRKYIETIKNKKGEFVSNDYSDLDAIFEEKLRDHLNILFPEQEHIKFVEEDLNIKNEEAVFGEDETDDASNFFEIGEEE